MSGQGLEESGTPVGRRRVLGLGGRPDTTVAELSALAALALRQADLTPGDLAAVASIEGRRGGAVAAIADAWGLPALYFDAAALERETPRLQTPSSAVFAAIGCHGVAEAAALAAAGPQAVLVVAKIRSGSATAAIAVAR